MKKKVIFILGTGHCGSTLLDLLLGSHSQGFSLGEIHRILKNDLTQDICDLCNDNCQIWTPEIIKELQSTKNQNLFERVLKRIDNRFMPIGKFYKKIFEITKKNFLIDSSKNAGWVLKNGKTLSKNNTIEPILLYLSRDGRAVINSLYRKNKEAGLNYFSEKWLNKMQKINKCYEDWIFGTKIHIKYEDLAQKPVETIQEILRLVDVKYEPQMMRFWEHEHHSVNGNAGTKSMILKFQDKHRYQGIDWNLNKKEYYKNHELGIKFDERWKTELNETQIESIEKRIYSLNKDII